MVNGNEFFCLFEKDILGVSKYPKDCLPSVVKNEIDLKIVSERKLVRTISRFGPLLALLLGLSLCFLFDLSSYFSFPVIKAYHLQLVEHVNNNRLISAVVYVISYTAIVSFSLPGGAMMTVVGGFLFGPMAGALLAVIGATLGANIIFLAARHALSDWFRPRAGSAIFKMREGLKANALSYLFFLRLVPIFPFFLVNLAPAFLGVKFSTYLIGTLFGIMPGTLIYAFVGDGLGAVIEIDANVDLDIIFAPRFLFPLIGLGVLALIPIIWPNF